VALRSRLQRRNLGICQRLVNESRGHRFCGHRVAVRQEVGVGRQDRLRVVPEASRYDVQGNRWRGRQSERGGRVPKLRGSRELELPCDGTAVEKREKLSLGCPRERIADVEVEQHDLCRPGYKLK